MPSLHLRLATITDAPALAQLAFDVMETSPLNNSYVVKSKYTGVKKQGREIGGDPQQYDLFLQQEIGATVVDIRNMKDMGRQICIAYEEGVPETPLGCVVTSLTPNGSGSSFDCVIEKFYAMRDVRKTGKFMLDAVKTSAAKMGAYVLKTKAAFGPHKFFVDNGFQLMQPHVGPNDNPLEFDLEGMRRGPQGARQAHGKPSVHIFPKQS